VQTFTMLFGKCSAAAGDECSKLETLEIWQNLLVIGVSSLFLILVLLRLRTLSREEEKSLATRVRSTKLVSGQLCRLSLTK
jgi:hypothetical protein